MNNIPEFSVTEISNLTKNILEENFSLIRVKGEISSVKNFKGHLYFLLKMIPISLMQFVGLQRFHHYKFNQKMV